MDQKLGGINLVRWQGARGRKTGGPGGWIWAAGLLLVALIGAVAAVMPAAPWVQWVGFAAMAPAVLGLVAVVLVRLAGALRPAVVWFFS
ncbi:MAG: hypothetical protein V4466_00720 [Pseudomonadota bacterium]